MRYGVYVRESTDNKEMYHIGDSIKDLGKKCFEINKIEDMQIIEKTIVKINKFDIIFKNDVKVKDRLNMSNAKEYFGKDFVNKIYEMFEGVEQEDRFIFIHGAYSLDDAISIALNGLECDYPELLYTAELMDKSDKLLFEKLKSWPHWDLKYLLTVCVPKSSGKGGIPIWSKNPDGQFLLSPHLINGIINVNEKSIIQNPKYDPLKNVEATIEDRSFETRTGKCIKISLPPNELEFYEEALKYEERD